MKSNLTDTDLAQLKERNISQDQMNGYKRDLKEGFPFVDLHANALKGSEIKFFGPQEIAEKRSLYASFQNLKIVKFVPASGAATRMFKDLFAALNDGQFNDSVSKFFKELKKFAFAETLIKEAGVENKDAYSHDEKIKILKALLLSDGMNYGELPKGSIVFHSYDGGKNRTAFEEHFYEAKLYAIKNGQGNIHFTIPAEQRAELDSYLARVSQRLSIELGVNFTVETSVQKPETDTPAIYRETEDWARLEDGSLLFRPAGHGALLENLNEIDADIIFVKNIDNVVPDRSKDETAKYKELLAGVLLQIQEKTFEQLRDHESGRMDIEAARKLLEETFSLNAEAMTEQQLADLLNRPIKVCGMVKNEGEPGGGPFVVQEKGNTSLQIVEKAQIDLDQESQRSILESATHFNPVDLVLGVRNFKGEKFDLLKFRNPQTGMRVEKTLHGKPIYALELPGLWNGAMYYWNTIFVEVPIETFNPVKTVLDLVRPAHLS